MSHSYGTESDILAGFVFVGNDENYGLILLTAICLCFHGHFFLNYVFSVQIKQLHKMEVRKPYMFGKSKSKF